MALGRHKARAQKAERVPFEDDPAKKGMSKGQRSRSPVLRDISAEKQYAKKKHGKIHLEKKIVCRVPIARVDIVVTIASVAIGILRNANT